MFGRFKTLMDLRAAYPFKPYGSALLKKFGRVEVMSYPCPEEDGRITFMVRLEPGDPTTLWEVNARDLCPVKEA